MEDSLIALRDRLVRFREERDWQEFHKPKSLALSVMIEGAELGELYQWSDNAESLNEVELEMADVLIYLINLAEVLHIDLASAAWLKIAINEQRYPPGEKYPRKTEERDVQP